MHVEEFPPVAEPRARVLVLGSLPGPVLLRERQYYAQPRNAFWPIMGELFGASPEWSCEQRLEILRRHHLALWDVCASAHRAGALDASIRRASVVPNDFAGFLASHPDLRLICFNGQMAADLYQRLVLPKVAESLRVIRREAILASATGSNPSLEHRAHSHSPAVSADQLDPCGAAIVWTAAPSRAE